MGIFELFLIGVSLSMDAFAVAICHGLSMPKLNLRHGVIIALFFGGFQALMPFLGWILGSQFARYIESVDHWVAFALLAVIGGNMVREALSSEEGEEETACDAADRLDLRRLFMMAVATSIDALAVGVTFAFLRWPFCRPLPLLVLLPFVSLWAVWWLATTLAPDIKGGRRSPAASC